MQGPTGINSAAKAIRCRSSSSRSRRSSTFTRPSSSCMLLARADQRFYKFTEALLYVGYCSNREVKVSRQGCQFRTPLRPDCRVWRKVVSGSFFEDAADFGSRLRVVWLTEHIDQQNVQNVARSRGRRRPGASVQLLCDLVGQFQASNWRDNWNPQFCKTMNSRCDQIDIVELGWPEVDVNSLPRARLVLERHLNPDRISLVHVTDWSFDAKRELIEAEVQSCGQRLKPVGPRGIDAEVEVLCSPGPLCKTQLHSDAPL